MQDNVATMKAARFRCGDTPAVFSISFCTNVYLANMVANPGKDTACRRENGRSALSFPHSARVQATTERDVARLWNAVKSWITPFGGFVSLAAVRRTAFVWPRVLPAVSRWGDVAGFNFHRKRNETAAMKWSGFLYIKKKNSTFTWENLRRRARRNARAALFSLHCVLSCHCVVSCTFIVLDPPPPNWLYLSYYICTLHCTMLDLSETACPVLCTAYMVIQTIKLSWISQKPYK